VTQRQVARLQFCDDQLRALHPKGLRETPDADRAHHLESVRDKPMAIQIANGRFFIDNQHQWAILPSRRAERSTRPDPIVERTCSGRKRSRAVPHARVYF
jgi:hypothetical protein